MPRERGLGFPSIRFLSVVATIPYKVAKMLVKHPLTDAGIAQFLKDWESVPKEKRVIVR